MKRLIALSSTFIALLAGFGSSQAAIIPLSGQNQTINLGTDPTATNVFAVAHPQGSFNDVYQFTLSQLSESIASAVSLHLPGFGSSQAIYNITGVNLALFSDPGGDGLGGTNTQLASVNFGDSNGSLGVLSLPAGHYFYDISGNAAGVKGGDYLFAANTVQQSVPVPEPEPYAMLLAGLGFLAYMSTRRRVL